MADDTPNKRRRESSVRCDRNKNSHIPIQEGSWKLVFSGVLLHLTGRPFGFQSLQQKRLEKHPYVFNRANCNCFSTQNQGEIGTILKAQDVARLVPY